MDEKNRPSDPPWHARTPEQRMTDAAIKMSVATDRNTAVLERLEHRLAVQPSAPLFDPRTLVPRVILVVAVAALVGSTVALAWVAPTTPAQCLVVEP